MPVYPDEFGEASTGAGVIVGVESSDWFLFDPIPIPTPISHRRHPGPRIVVLAGSICVAINVGACWTGWGFILMKPARQGKRGQQWNR